MKKLVVIMLVVGIFVVEAGADSLGVLSYTGSALTPISSQKDVTGSLVIMADHTGDLKGDGQQHIVYYDGTTLVGLKYNSGTSALETSVYRNGVAAPVQLVTGDHIGADTYDADSVAVYDSTGFAYIYAGTGLQFSYYRGRALGTGYTKFAIGNVIDSGYTGSELLGYYGGEKTYGWTNSSTSSLTAPVVGSYPHMYNDANLMDLDHLDMSAGSLNDMMLGFDDSGTWLVLQNSAGAYSNGRSGIGVNVGAADEALFLQVGDVNSYSNAGPEEGVIYRKDGGCIAYTAKTDGSFTSPSLGNIGAGVDEMLIGDILGDSLEEVVVSKGDLIEVWSLAATSPSLLTSYNVNDGLLDFALGDMNGNGKQDIIIGVVPEPTTIALLSLGGLLLRRRKA